MIYDVRGGGWGFELGDWEGAVGLGLRKAVLVFFEMGTMQMKIC